MSKKYDVVIIGGGPGGYVAAIRASQLGLETAVVESYKVGGTCLHAGCIPSKALLRSAEVYANTVNGETFGVIAPDVSLDFSKVQGRKEQITDQLFKGVQHLLKKGKIDVFDGKGSLSGANEVTVSKDGEENQKLETKNVVLATGSRPRSLPGLDIDGKHVLTSDEALVMEELPESMIIVGGGVIGIEWASMLADFGVKVTVLEYADRILPTEDKDVSREMNKSLKKKRVKVVTSAQVLPETLSIGDEVSIIAKRRDKENTYTADKILVSVGRAPNVEGLGLEELGVEVDRGFIQTNDNYQTAAANIYAIGDVIGGMQLAHVASHEGISAVEHISGKEVEALDNALVSRCVYSSPEVSSVGLTEEQAKDAGYELEVGKFPLRAVGKSLVHGNVDGFVKFVVDKDTRKLLGAHMVGPNVTEMITEVGLGLVLEATSMDVVNTIHPHPSLSEAVGEAALAIDGIAIHS